MTLGPEGLFRFLSSFIAFYRRLFLLLLLLLLLHDRQDDIPQTLSNVIYTVSYLLY